MVFLVRENTLSLGHSGCEPTFAVDSASSEFEVMCDIHVVWLLEWSEPVCALSPSGVQKAAQKSLSSVYFFIAGLASLSAETAMCTQACTPR